jgi:hypothetical protein
MRAAGCSFPAHHAFPRLAQQARAKRLRPGLFGHVRAQGSKNARRVRMVPVVLPWAREFLRFVLWHTDGPDG